MPERIASNTRNLASVPMTSTAIITKAITSNITKVSLARTEIMTTEITLTTTGMTTDKVRTCQLRSDSNCYALRLITSTRPVWRTWLTKQGAAEKNWNDNFTMTIITTTNLATTRFSI